MSETLINNPEQLTAQDVGNLMLGAVALVQNDKYPEVCRNSWMSVKRQTRNITPFYDNVELSREPREVKLSVPQFYLGQDPLKFEDLDELENVPAPHADYYFERREDGTERWRGNEWLKAMVALNAHYSISSVSYGLYANPMDHGYARTLDGVLIANASSYDQKGIYTPPGFRTDFAELLDPIVKYGETLRTDTEQ